MNGDEDIEGIVVPPDSLRPETLRSIAEEFVTREGTDYGVTTYTLEQKVDRVLGQLRRGEAQVTFDPNTGSIGIESIEPN